MSIFEDFYSNTSSFTLKVDPSTPDDKLNYNDLYIYKNTNQDEFTVIEERNRTKECDIHEWRLRRSAERSLLEDSNETVLDIIEHQQHLKLNYGNALKEIEELFCILITEFEKNPKTDFTLLIPQKSRLYHDYINKVLPCTTTETMALLEHLQEYE
jgi:hypothetical protein